MSQTQPTTEVEANRPDIIDFESVLETRMELEEDDGSHTEFDPRVFHPSSVGYDEWLIMVNKLGLSDKSHLRGTFKMGDLIHQYVQDAVWNEEVIPQRHDLIEKEVDFDEDGLTFVGHADVYDPEQNIVYDIKSRGSWYNFEPPVDRHIDQLHCYMRGLDAKYGQVVYISKKDMEVRTWPNGAPFTFDDARWDEIKARCKRVRDAIYDGGIPQSEGEIPFEKPDNYFANSTSLDFSHVNGSGA